MIHVTGHRGARDLAPENTLAGFMLAGDLGCHAVELDVNMTRDSQLAVIHDDSLDRTTDGSGAVASYTLRELQRFDAGNGERIPSLEQVLEHIRPSAMLVQIELKGEGTEFVAPEVVRRQAMAQRVRFTSFFHRRLLEVRRLLPEAQTGVLTDTNPVDPLHMLRSALADTFHVKHPRIDRWLVEQLHQAGHRFVALGRIVDNHTVDRLVALGVDVIGSDRPDLVIERLKHHSQYQPPG